MSTKIKFSFYASILFLFIASYAKATHVAGADITYQNIGANSYLVRVAIFEDCGGAATVGSTITVRFTNTCGTSAQNVTFNQVSNSEVSQLCAAEQPNSSCNGGSLPGMRQKVYEKVMTLAPCNNWKITWGVANRNASVNLDPVGNTMFFAVTAELNTIVAPNNSSPAFNSQPIPYVCANQFVNYSFGVSESDGDSLVYSFADPLGGTVNNPIVLNYQAGYSVTQPLPGITINAATGLLSFTPTMLGSFVVVVQVQEYRNGALIGFVKRDIQFVVRPCSNNPPDIAAGEITNLTGIAVLTDPFTIELCEGNSFSFTSIYTDQNASDFLTLQSNIATVLPGAVLTQTGVNPLIVNISWTAPAGSSGQNTSFSVNINDGACPIPGAQTFVYNIEVVPSTFILPGNTTLCGTDSIQLQAIGGSDFTWFDSNGVQIVPGPEFSCNNCPSPIARPTTTTSYIVQSNLSSTCINRDTITVAIAADFQITTLASSTTICVNDSVQFNIQASNGGAPYTYQWSPAVFFNNSTISNPTAIFNTAGTFSIIVDVLSNQNCSRKDTISVEVISSPIFTIPQYGPYCSDAALVDLDYSVQIPGLIENWSGPGITDSLTGMFSPVIAGQGAHTINVTIQTPGGTCANTQSTVINVGETPNAEITVPSTNLCKGDQPVQINAITPGGTWSSANGLSNSGVFSPSTAAIGTTQVIYSFAGVCPSSDTINFVVNQNPPAPSLTQDNILCAGTVLPEGNVHATGINGGVISWYVGSNLQGLINTGNNFKGDFTSTTTIYAYDSLNGCKSNTASLVVNFNPKPLASFTADPSTGRGTIPFVVNLTNSSTGYNAWMWNFGDDSDKDSTNFNITHTFSNGGVFRVILSVENQFGCTDTLGFTIVAEEEMIIPNVFTPNGDGINDEFYFKVDPLSVKSFNAIIVDRWGKKVTEFTSVKDKWDGGNYPAGTYYYTIQATSANGNPFSHTHGFFKLLK